MCMCERESAVDHSAHALDRTLLSAHIYWFAICQIDKCARWLPFASLPLSFLAALFLSPEAFFLRSKCRFIFVAPSFRHNLYNVSEEHFFFFLLLFLTRISSFFAPLLVWREGKNSLTHFYSFCELNYAFLLVRYSFSQSFSLVWSSIFSSSSFLRWK